MIDILKEHPRAVLFAVIFHLLIVIVVGVSVDWTSLTKPSGEKTPVKIVNAVVVDQKLVDKEVKKIKDAEKKRIRKQKNAERKRKREEKKLKKLKTETKKEKARLRALKKKRNAKLKKDKARKLKAKKEKQRKAAEKKRQEQFEKELKSKLDKEENERQAAIAVANEARRQSEIGKYLDMIKLKVRNNWITFRSKEPGKIAVVRVKVIPGGEVITAKIVQSSNDSIFDKDAEKAVYNASPLPIPPADSDIMNEFREFDLRIGTPK